MSGFFNAQKLVQYAVTNRCGYSTDVVIHQKATTKIKLLLYSPREKLKDGREGSRNSSQPRVPDFLPAAVLKGSHPT